MCCPTEPGCELADPAPPGRREITRLHDELDAVAEAISRREGPAPARRAALALGLLDRVAAEVGQLRRRVATETRRAELARNQHVDQVLTRLAGR